MTVRRTEINGKTYLTFRWGTEASEEELRNFTGRYFGHVRPEDRVACLRRRPDFTEDVYVTPGTLLVKPEDRPEASPLPVPARLGWAVTLFLGEHDA